MIQVRMVAVSAHPERAAASESDVVRLGWVRDAAPTRGERELVRECGEEGRGAVHLVQVLVLHEDDDELVEVVRRLREHGSWTHRAIGNVQEDDSRADEGAEEDEHGHQPGAYNVNP